MPEPSILESDLLKSATPENIIHQFQLNKIDLLTKHSGVVRSQSGTERESSKDYEGRVVFELFQNAVDRAERLIVIELMENHLIISNDGIPFSILPNYHKKTDFEGLCTIHDSAKRAGESIGNKGVGFKSVWNVCQEVLIESVAESGLTWGFELFNPLDPSRFEEVPDVSKALAEFGDNVPSFYFPKFHHPSEDELVVNIPGAGIRPIKTRITLPIDEKGYVELDQQIKEFATANLCFLPLLNKDLDDLEVIMIVNGKTTRNDNHQGWKVVDLRSQALKGAFAEQIAKLDAVRVDYLKKYDNIPLLPNVAIAFPPPGFKEFTGYVYTFLPTRIDFGHHVLLHGDFALDNSRTGIPPNEYNICLLEIAGDLFVNTLAADQSLYHDQCFGSFLRRGSGNLPLKTGEDLHQRIWNKFYGDGTMLNILRQVYTINRKWDQTVYTELFTIIEQLFNREGTIKNKNAPYSVRISKLIHTFCDEDVFIVPVSDGALTTLPNPISKPDKETLFYRPANSQGTEMLVRLLDHLKGIKISDFPELNSTVLQNYRIIRSFNSQAVLDTINKLQKNFQNESEREDTFAFCFHIAQQKTNVTLANFFDTEGAKEERDLGEIEVPVHGKGWEMARRSYTGNQYSDLIDEDYFSNINIERCAEILKERGLYFNQVSIQKELPKMGAWQHLLPLKWDKVGGNPYKFALPWKTTPEDRSMKLKSLVNASIGSFRLFSNAESIWELLRAENWFFVENQKRFVNLKEIFLYSENDRRALTCIAKENKKDAFSDFYNIFQVQSIDDTSSSEKLFRQLNRMSLEPFFNMETGHVETYRSLINAFSKKADFSKLGRIPVLIQNGGSYEYRQTQTVFYAARDFKRHKHLFKDYLFTCFDDEVSQAFCTHNGIILFQPNFNIQYTDQKRIDDAFKITFEKDHFPYIWALATNQLRSKLNNEDCLQRWLQFKVFKDDGLKLLADDHEKKGLEIPDLGQGGNVFYIPLTQAQREASKYTVGEIAHDVAHPLASFQLVRFASILADGVFRNNALTDLFAGYLHRVYLLSLTGTEKNLIETYLQDHGMTMPDIDQARHFIEAKMLSKEDEVLLISRLCSFTQNPNITFESWMQPELYQDCKLSYSDLLTAFEDIPKLRQLVTALNPVSQNRLLLIKERLLFKALVYLSDDAHRILSDQGFDQIINTDLSGYQYFNFLPDYFYADFDIKNFDPNQIKAAKIIIEHQIEGWPRNAKQPSLSGNTIGLSAASGHIGIVDPEEEETKRSAQHKQGIGFELLLLNEGIMAVDKNAYKSILQQAVLIMQREDAIHPQKLRTAYIHKLSALIESREPEFNDLMQFLHVSKAIGDGLGYDILYPQAFPDGRLLKVEIKSAKGHKVYFSEVERKKFLTLGQDQDWRFWINQVCDRTLTDEFIAYLEEHQQQLTDLEAAGQYHVSADNWFIQYS